MSNIDISYRGQSVEEGIRGYLEWQNEDIDKSPEAYVRYLEDEANRVTVQTVLDKLTEVQTMMGEVWDNNFDLSRSFEEQLNAVETLVNESVNVLLGDHEYINTRNISGTLITKEGIL